MRAGTVLSSQAVTRQVFSPLLSLTSVFGMGTGGTSTPLAPIMQPVHMHKLIYVAPSDQALAQICTGQILVTRAGIEPALPA